MKSTLLATLLLAFPLVLGSAQASAAEAGFDYQVLATAQPKETKAKVEIIEFFSYRCPHCFHLEPSLKEWIAKQPAGVKVIRQPVIFSDKWEPAARAYFALESIGAVEGLHYKVFQAMHEQGFNFDDTGTFYDWAAKQGVDVNKLRDAYNSFSTLSKVARAKQLARNYKLEGVPTLAVNGKYLTSVSMTGSQAAMYSTLDELVRKESGAKEAPKAAGKTVKK
jgi:thiol:disulfide interchange protein DsbA